VDADDRKKPLDPNVRMTLTSDTSLGVLFLIDNRLWYLLTLFLSLKFFVLIIDSEIDHVSQQLDFSTALSSPQYPQHSFHDLCFCIRSCSVRQKLKSVASLTPDAAYATTFS
jgi:hypothetical protein